MPRLIVVAGVNGSGKSTLTMHKRFNNLKVIDPDAIAKKIASDRSASARVLGGREAIRRRLAYLADGRTFVLETTLAGHSTLKLMQKARQHDYSIELHYVFLESAAQSAKRVKTRVYKGGHNIPQQDIERRFQRSRERFEDAALVADITYVYNNTFHEDFFEPVLIAEAGNVEIDPDAPDWLQESVARIRARATKGGARPALIWHEPKS